MLPELKTVFCHVLKVARYWAGDKLFELMNPATGKFEANRSDDPMWGRIILRSAASGGGLESATAKAAWLDECGQDQFAVDTWEAVLRRLSLSQGPVLGTTTLYNLGWTKTEVYDRWLAGDPNFEVIQFDSRMNPAFPDEEQERARTSMATHRFLMAYCGQFSRPAGLIYADFRSELHTCQPFDVPAHWPHYLGVDFGGANTAVLLLAHDQEADRYFVTREQLSGGKSSSEHCQELLEEVRGRNLVCSWGGAKSEGQQRWDWSAAGVEVLEPPVSDVEAGIDRVTQLLKERRIQVFRTCKGLLDEFGTYRRKLDSTGQPLEEIEDKRRYHRLDSLRYVCAGLLNPVAFPFAVAVGEARDAGLVNWDSGAANPRSWW